MTSTSRSPARQGEDDAGRTRHQAGCETAAAYLSSLGYQILHQNWRHDGALELVAGDRAELVAAIVKTRTRAHDGKPPEAVSQAQARHLRGLAARWLDEHSTRYERVRIDIVGVLFEGTGGYTIEHHKGAA